jgi:hypothetical protein
VSTDILILDDFALDAMDPTESRDIYEVILDRHQQRSTVITSNRSPDEWLSVMAGPLRAQSAIDRLINNAYELVIEGEFYRRNQKPRIIDPPDSSDPAPVEGLDRMKVRTAAPMRIATRFQGRSRRSAEYEIERITVIAPTTLARGPMAPCSRHE